MTDIADIKPDTSLYSTMADKLRAMALILEGSPGDIQIKVLGIWSHSSATNTGRVANLFAEACDYRLKPEPPKPRELWCIEIYTGDLYRDGDGKPRTYTAEPGCATGNKPVRFVEQL